VIRVKYSLKCPLCSQSTTIDADNDDAAVAAFLEESKKHMKEQHPMVPSMPDEQLQNLIRYGMKKEE
jgi:hypothetical protein